MTPPGLRAVVIGAGAHIFQAAHVPAIVATGVRVVGVLDADPARVTAVASQLDCSIAGSLDELLTLDAEAAVVCAPHPLHSELVEACLRRGLWVLVEKPLAARLAEIDALAAVEADGTARVAVVHQHRLRDEVIAARDLIRAGELGRIHRAVVVGSYPKRSGYYTDTPWRGTWQGEGGGVLLNQGLHDVDVLVHLLGTPSRVQAALRHAAHPIDAEDSAEVLLEWADGATGTVHITSAAALDGNRIEIYGSRGAIRLSDRGLERRSSDEDFVSFAETAGGHFDRFAVGEWHLEVPHGAGTHTDVYADFVRAWSDDSTPATTARTARDAVEVIAAAQLASADRAAVNLPIDSTQFDEFLDARIEAARSAERMTDS